MNGKSCELTISIQREPHSSAGHFGISNAKSVFKSNPLMTFVFKCKRSLFNGLLICTALNTLTVCYVPPGVSVINQAQLSFFFLPRCGFQFVTKHADTDTPTVDVRRLRAVLERGSSSFTPRRRRRLTTWQGRGRSGRHLPSEHKDEGSLASPRQ